MPYPTQKWDDLWKGEHARAFMVAGAIKGQLLTDFADAIGRAIEDGETLEDFRKRFDQIVKKHGWSYNGGRDWRTRVIYETNLDQAYMAGKWTQIERLKDRRPYLRYVHGASVDPRPEHLAWHGLILPVDDPFWQTHYPKNGWGCTCTVMQLSDDDLKRYGWTVSPPPPIKLDPKTGLPAGIDKGFDYNVGIAHVGRRLADDALATWEADQAKARAAGKATSGWQRITPGSWATAGRPERLPARPAQARPANPPPKTAAEAEALLIRLFGASELTLALPKGLSLYVNAASLAGHFLKNMERARLLPLLPELLRDPDEIWQGFEVSEQTGRMVLRQQIIKAVELDKERYLLMVAQARDGRFEAWTLLETRQITALNARRVGKLLYGRELPPS